MLLELGCETKMDKNNEFKMVAAAILNFIYSHNSFTIACICTKFGMSIKFLVLHTYMQILNRKKSKMAVAAILICVYRL